MARWRSVGAVLWWRLDVRFVVGRMEAAEGPPRLPAGEALGLFEGPAVEAARGVVEGAG